VILSNLLQRKRSLSRRIVVPSSMSATELADFFLQLASGGAPEGDILGELDRKDWRSFEMWVADRFQSAGWQVFETPRTGDGGADLIARHPAGGRPAIIQAKHRGMGNGTVDDSAVREVLAAPGRYRRSHSWLSDPLLLVVSNGRMELRAETLATQHRVRTIDRLQIAALDAAARDLIVTAGR